MIRGLAPFLLLGLATVAAAREPPLAGPLLSLDRDRPLVPVVVAGQTLRLALDLNQTDMIVVDPAVAARLPLRFAPDMPLDVGRTRLSGRAARAEVRIGGVAIRTHLFDYGRPCCMGADGAIGLDLLPYAEVRLERAAAGPVVLRRYPLAASDAFGRYVAQPTGGGTLGVVFSLVQPETNATAAGGALLLAEAGGTLDPTTRPTVSLFGLSRPARLLRLDRPVEIAGFRVAALPVRIGDLRGRYRLPADPVAPGELVVRGRASTQQPWPAVTIGRDRLDACPLVAYRRADQLLTLGCPA